MTSLRRCSLLVLAAALAGCSSMQVKTEYDPKASYETYKTYAWLATEPGTEQAAAVRNPATRAVIVAAVDRELKAKGIVRATPDANPDFYVSVIGWGQSRVEVSNYGYSYGAAYAYAPYGATMAPVTQVSEYTEGTMLLDFVDAKTKTLFWRGTASDTVTSPAQIRETVDNAVHKLMEAYPPAAKK
jgi:Tfp pilus assembly protein PilV